METFRRREMVEIVKGGGSGMESNKNIVTIGQGRGLIVYRGMLEGEGREEEEGRSKWLCFKSRIVRVKRAEIVGF